LPRSTSLGILPIGGLLPLLWSRGVVAHPRYLRSEAASISTKDRTPSRRRPHELTTADERSHGRPGRAPSTPMKNHTLMQAIARANRVLGDKVNGLIVDASASSAASRRRSRSTAQVPAAASRKAIRRPRTSRSWSSTCPTPAFGSSRRGRRPELHELPSTSPRDEGGRPEKSGAF
jgi:hypothetical protein